MSKWPWNTYVCEILLPKPKSGVCWRQKLLRKKGTIGSGVTLFLFEPEVSYCYTACVPNHKIVLTSHPCDKQHSFDSPMNAIQRLIESGPSMKLCGVDAVDATSQSRFQPCYRGRLPKSFRLVRGVSCERRQGEPSLTNFRQFEGSDSRLTTALTTYTAWSQNLRHLPRIQRAVIIIP